MTRQKVKLEFINNDSSRKACYNKRKKGFMKKVSELSTLCGIDACAIIYSPDDSRPEVWPNTLGVQRVLAKFQRMPEMEKTKRMFNQEGFIKQQIARASEKMQKICKENREKEVTEVMYQCLTGTIGVENLNMGDLYDLAWIADKKMKEIEDRIASLVAAPAVVDAPNLAQ